MGPASRTPLLMAAEFGHAEVLEVLLQADISLEATMDDGRTALSCACAKGHLQVVQCLLAAQADPLPQETNSGQTALHVAAAKGNAEIINELLTSPSTRHPNDLIACRDAKGQQALHLAVAQHQGETLRALLLAGAELPEEVASTPLVLKLVAEMQADVAKRQQQVTRALESAQVKEASSHFQDVQSACLQEDSQEKKEEEVCGAEGSDDAIATEEDFEEDFEEDIEEDDDQKGEEEEEKQDEAVTKEAEKDVVEEHELQGPEQADFDKKEACEEDNRQEKSRRENKEAEGEVHEEHELHEQDKVDSGKTDESFDEEKGQEKSTRKESSKGNSVKEDQRQEQRQEEDREAFADELRPDDKQLVGPEAVANGAARQPQLGPIGVPPSSAADCKTEEELIAWRKDEVNTAKKFVPKMFQATTLQNIENDYQSKLQRIKTEKQHADGEEQVEVVKAENEDTSELEEPKVVKQAKADNRDMEREVVEDEEDLRANSDKKIAVEEEGEDKQNKNKANETERQDEHREVEQEAVVDGKKQESDKQKVAAASDANSAVGRPQHGHTGVPPSCAADCKTEEELIAWRTEEVNTAKKFVPKMFQASTLQNIEQDYQANLQRIKAAQQHAHGEATNVVEADTEKDIVPEESEERERVNVALEPEQAEMKEFGQAAASVEILEEAKESETITKETSTLQDGDMGGARNEEAHELKGANVAEAEEEPVLGLKKNEVADMENEGTLDSEETKVARGDRDEPLALKESQLTSADKEYVLLEEEKPARIGKEHELESNTGTFTEAACSEEDKKQKQPAESAYKRMLELFGQQEKNDTWNRQKETAKDSVEEQRSDAFESARSQSSRSSRSSRSTSSSYSSSSDESEGASSDNVAPQSSPPSARSAQKQPSPILVSQVSARCSGATPGFRPSSCSSRCSSASSAPGPGIDVDGPAAHRLVQDFLEFLAKGSENCGQAWLRHVDKRKTGLVKFRHFCAALAKIKFQGDVMLLWHALKAPLLQQANGGAVRGLSMEAVDPASAASLRECGEWFARRFPQGGLFEAFAMLDVSGTGCVSQVQLCKRLRKLGFFADGPNEGSLAALYPSEIEFIEELMPLLDLSCRGSILAEDFFLLEPSPELRKQLLVRFEGSRARTSKGFAPAGDVAALQRAAAMEAAQQPSPSTSARQPSQLLAPPTHQNSAASMLSNLVKASGQLGGKHWKQSGAMVAEMIDLLPGQLQARQQKRQGQGSKGGRAAAASKRKPPLPPSTPLEPLPTASAVSEVQASSEEQLPTRSPARQLSPSASSPVLLPRLNIASSGKVPSRFSTPSAPVRGSSLPDLRSGAERARLTADQEAAAIRLAAQEAAAAAQAADAAVEAKKLKKKVRCLYGQKQFEKQVQSGFLPALPKALPAGRAAHVAVPLWQDRQQRRQPLRTGSSNRPGAREAFFARGSDQNLFERYYEAEMPAI
eukprot:TRINITY_DN7137_c0_g3_i1.p1 TRINITY_DN7137_c0_g3~~TRINITY_DN7137_c0_g3_i1.p1  ORF type:complete len:1706 (+),score=455.17 TRINITY_DN7137_c0_g3_i1:763-5118(+)